jgi:hypothetical protein
MARMAPGDEAAFTSREGLMSDKAMMLRETGEAFSDLRAMFDWLTEEQASRVWLGVLGVRETLIHIREHTVRNRDWRVARTLQTAARIRMARSVWAPGSFWGVRYPSK